MLRPLSIADKLYGQPKSPDYIAFATAIFPVNRNSWEQLGRRRPRNQTLLERTQAGCRHRQYRFIAERTIILKTKFYQHKITSSNN